jgi:outer membrane lipoprotein-sorting protein
VEDRRNGCTGDLLERATAALRDARIPPGPPAEALRRALDAGLEVHVAPLSAGKGVGRMGVRLGRMVRIAAAASILAAVGALVCWVVREGSTNIAFASVAYVLEHIHSATFDMTVEMTRPDRTITMRAKGSFLAPSGQRIEAAQKGDMFGDMVIVADYESGRGVVLLPRQKVAVVINSGSIKEQINNPMASMFEAMRCLVHEGRGRTGRITPIGKKEIDGQTVVGFFARSAAGDMTLWANPRTAKPVRIELDMPAMKAQGVLSNFAYDVQLDPSLFRLEAPAGYLSERMEVGVPLEKGLIETLRVVAEQNHGMFPKRLGINREVIDALESIAGPDIAAIASGDAEDATEVVMSTLPFEQKYMQGILFYMSLKPQNEPHYAGGGVKLGAVNRPIFWYKPAGAERFRVIYADLHVKEMSPDEVKSLPIPAK